MKMISAILVFSTLSIASATSIALAQQTPSDGQNVKKEHLEYCVSQLTMQVAQMQAIEAVKKNPTLSPMQKLQQIRQILTPPQKQQLMACMEQPMPSPAGTP
jgi:Spy/CpxP family protein refolding chaperone